jgi:hypothetical protein
MTDTYTNNENRENKDSLGKKLRSLMHKNNTEVPAENSPVLTAESPDNASQAYQKVKKVLLSEYGFEQAGLNKGNNTALENFLHAIKEGHVVDISFSESDHQKRKAAIEEKIAEKSNLIIDYNNNAENLEKILIPEIKNEITEKEKEINQIHIEKMEGRLVTEYSKSRHHFMKSLVGILGVYLVVFYASAIDAVFFRNLLEDLSTSGTAENINLLLNSIFNPHALFQWKESSIFIYLGSALFFALGLLPHLMMKRQKRIIYKFLIGAIFLAIPLAGDFLIALKIHMNILQAKELMGLEDPTHWYQSTNFYLVIVFGYFAYMVWAIIYEESHREAAKKNTEKSAAYKIRFLKNEIKKLREEMKEMQIRLQDMKGNIQKLHLEIEKLRSQLNRVLQDPNLLFRNLHNFYEGWLRYINAGENKDYDREKCEKTFKSFMETKFKTESIINN